MLSNIRSALQALQGVSAWLCKAIALTSMALIFMVLCANVFVRYLKLGNAKFGAEIPELLFPWLVASSVGLAAIHGSHISVQFLKQRLSESSARWLNIFIGLITIAVYGLALYIVVDLLPIVKDDLSPIYKISLAWTYAAMGLAFATIVIDQLARIAGTNQPLVGALQEHLPTQ